MKRRLDILTFGYKGGNIPRWFNQAPYIRDTGNHLATVSLAEDWRLSEV